MKTGRVYKIVVGQSEECYIGSTFDDLKYRFRGHKKSYKSYLNGVRKTVSSVCLFEKYGIENCKIVLIKEYLVDNKNHLRNYESLWISKHRKCCVNKLDSAGYIITKSKRTLLKLYSSIKSIEYKNLNKDVISIRRKEYREKNKEVISVRKKEYYQKNKEEIIKKNAIFRKNNWNTIYSKQSERILCECGIETDKQHLNRHLKSKRHIKIMEGTYVGPERVLCECGSEVIEKNMNRHKRTQKHIEIMKNL